MQETLVQFLGREDLLASVRLPTPEFLGFPGASAGKEFTCSAGDLGSIPGLGTFLEKAKATHSSILAWRIPWTVQWDRTELLSFTFSFSVLRHLVKATQFLAVHLQNSMKSSKYLTLMQPARGLIAVPSINSDNLQFSFYQVQQCTLKTSVLFCDILSELSNTFLWFSSQT